ncbi:homoserine kinase [Candidatus Planktophila sulfonica]|jgi:homoserine kinase|uniref:Homoserine kinase n=1 Tax=Candidatus Planktophila sulfonica TaxID=1884904 RepID=A0A249KFH8_9ACTN|nr:homoserine kinase [Candidatus Planktophila sulfonica]ASY15553.1 homoserine kinase [Candidatus Planktophila sulfonica]
MAKPTFKANPIQVQVPATSANLGPGFDSFGLAFGMYDRYVAQILDEGGLDIDVTGEGADEVPRTDKNLLVKAMYKGFDFLGGKPKGVAVRALNVIPHGRGLGSSASAIIGGLVLARSLVLTGTDKMSDEALLNLANEMEGHPDNVAAALYGGATVAWQDVVKGKAVAHAVHLPVDPRIKVMAFIPSTPLATKKARTMLPETIPFADALRNSSNAALLTQALTIRPDLLFTATEDFLHQSYRQEAMPASFALMTKLRAAGIAAFISGAGPTVLALHTEGDEESIQLSRAGGAKFEGKSLEIASRGATLL